VNVPSCLTSFLSSASLCPPEPKGTPGRAADRKIAVVSPSAVASWPGRELSGWSDPLLELFFRYLDPGDLRSCALVCRQWNRVAGDLRLQARALMRTYPSFERRCLETALGPERASLCLSPWCAALAPGSTVRLELEARIAQGLAGKTLFCTFMQQLLGAERFCSFSYQRKFRMRCTSILVCSPDASAMADVGSDFLDQPHRITLWRSGDRGLHPLFSVQHHRPICALFFSADSRRLQAIDKDGRQRTWQRSSTSGAAVWQEVGRVALCCRPVDRLAASPDGGYLAVVSGDVVQIFASTPAAGWQQQWVWRWSQSLRRLQPPSVWSSRGGSLEFSNDGRHLLFSNRGEMFMAHREGAVWQEQSIVDEQGQPVHSLWQTEAVMDPGGSWLALARNSRQGAAATEAVHYRVTLFGFAPGRGWSPVSRYICNECDMDIAFLMSFSADGQQLVFLDSWSRWDSRLCVLSAAGQPPWSQAAFMDYVSRLSTVVGNDKCCIPRHVEFSVNGRVLVAVGGAGVHIWRRTLARSWASAAWISRAGRESCRDAVFSPDGFHLGLAWGAQGEVSVWGPRRDGLYIRKARFLHGRPVKLMRFTPDASQLLIGSWGYRESLAMSTELGCLQLVPYRRPGSQEARKPEAVDEE